MSLFSLQSADRRATARTTNFVEPCSFQQKKSQSYRRTWCVAVTVIATVFSTRGVTVHFAGTDAPFCQLSKRLQKRTSRKRWIGHQFQSASHMTNQNWVRETRDKPRAGKKNKWQRPLWDSAMSRSSRCTNFKGSVSLATGHWGGKDLHQVKRSLTALYRLAACHLDWLWRRHLWHDVHVPALSVGQNHFRQRRFAAGAITGTGGVIIIIVTAVITCWRLTVHFTCSNAGDITWYIADVSL